MPHKGKGTNYKSKKGHIRVKQGEGKRQRLDHKIRKRTKKIRTANI